MKSLALFLSAVLMLAGAGNTSNGVLPSGGSGSGDTRQPSIPSSVMGRPSSIAKQESITAAHSGLTPTPLPNPNCPGHFSCGGGECVPMSWICDGTNDCEDGSDEGNCEHRSCDPEFRCESGYRLCVSAEWVCDGTEDCEDGSDEAQDCTPTETPGCKSNQFRCSNGQCVPQTSVCNGEQDCGDGGDESGCSSGPGQLCSSDLFTCTSGQCIPSVWKCDGFEDCWDGSDEPTECSPRPCAEDEFSCDNGQCIVKDLACDGYGHCGDNSDEANCGTTGGCSGGQFRCKSGQCISRLLVCDGEEDCVDGEDETANAGCLSQTTTTCEALKNIMFSIQDASDYIFTCSVISPCPEATSVRCIIIDGQRLDFLVLPCHKPHSAIRIINKNFTGKVTFDHVFTDSEEVPAVVDDFAVILDVKLKPGQKSIAVQLTAQFVGYSTTYIPYTEIPINTTEAYCRDSDSPGTSSGENCEVLQTIADSGTACSVANDCGILLCVLPVFGERGDNPLPILGVKVLECQDPSAIVLSLINGSQEIYTHTFLHTEEIVLPLPVTATVSLNVTIGHQGDSTFGFEVLLTEDGRNVTVIPYSSVDISHCSTKEGAGHGVMVIAVSAGGAALLVMAVCVPVCCVVLCRLRHRKRQERQRLQFEAALRPFTDSPHASSDEEEEENEEEEKKDEEERGED